MGRCSGEPSPFSAAVYQWRNSSLPDMSARRRSSRRALCRYTLPVPVADIAAGHYASTAILACLSRRLVTGRGEYIDIALYDSIVSWLTYLASYYFATVRQPPRMGSAHPSI